MYCHDREEYSINKGENGDDFNSKLYFSKFEEKRVVLKSSSTKRNDSDTNHGKKISSGLQNLIDELADSRINRNGIISKFNRPCGLY